MSIRLADFLVAVSEPNELKAYKSDPAGYVSRFGLSSGDMNALKSGVAAWIRLQAKSTEDGADWGPTHPAVIDSSAAGELDVSLVMDIFEASDGSSDSTTTFEDEDGRLVRAIPES